MTMKRAGDEGVIDELARTVSAYVPVSLRSTIPPPSDDGGLEPDAVGPRYVEREEIGRGGLGVVLEAFDRDLRRAVAIKRVSATGEAGAGAARLVREAQITAQLEHPNIPAVHGLGVDAQGRPYFTMTRLRGSSLAELLERRGEAGLSTARLLRIFLQVSYAVAFAHSRGVLHRDLKPHNVMIGQFGEVRLIDWGIAKLLDSAEDASAPPLEIAEAGRVDQTRAGDLLGTPSFAAPEQLEGRTDLDERADIYALGALLYTMLAGRPPVQADNLLQLIHRVTGGEITPLRHSAPASAPLQAVVHKALALRREERYPSALELIADVEALLEGRRVSAGRDGPLRRVGRWYLSHSPRVSRLRPLEIDLWCWGALCGGIWIGAELVTWLSGWQGWIGLLGLLCSVPAAYTLLRRPRPDDPGTVVPFTEGIDHRTTRREERSS